MIGNQQQSTANTTQKELKVFNNQYVVRKKLSSGSFGVVFQGEDRATGEQIALKIEKDDGEDSKSLDRESHILSRLQGIKGVPKLYWSGTEGNYNIMVIQLLGRDLAYHIKNLKKFSLKSLLMITEQLLIILEQCHMKGVVHRDMKPENVIVGRDPTEIFLVDFGISKIYKDSKGVHIPFRDEKPFIGTTRYASIAAHKGFELGRCDDLESMGYMLVFLYKGNLPWQNLQNVSDKEKTKVVGRMKMQIEVQDLCKDMPVEFVQFFEYVKSLQFKSNPDYKFLIQLIRKCGKDKDIEFDYKYDWYESERKAQEKQSQKNSHKNSQKKNDNLKNRNTSKNKIQQSGESEKPMKHKSQDKRTSLVMPDLQSSSGNSSQFDFLRPPDPHAKAKAILKRSQDRHKSVSSLAPSQYSMANTFQSSVCNKYQGSNMVNDFGNNSENQSKGEVKKKEVIESKNFGFQPIEGNETIGMHLGEDDEEGPSLQYENLLSKQVHAQFKSGLLNDRNKRSKSKKE